MKIDLKNYIEGREDLFTAINVQEMEAALTEFAKWHKEQLRIGGVLGSSFIWNSPANSTDTNRLKQHAYVSKNYKPNFYTDEYEGNESLCGISRIFEDERCVSVDEIEQESLIKDKACKRCLSKYKKLLS